MLDVTAPVGVFDSGIGGLTVLHALRDALPGEQFIYLGDTARLPYGIKSAATIERYSRQAAEALLRYGVKCIVVACNTASSVGLPAIRAVAASVPVIGVIEPGAVAACEATRSGHIAVIATESTVKGGAYQRAIQQRRADAQVCAAPAQLFVALAEEGLTRGPIAESIARHYLTPLLERCAADTLVLGCTHFPMLLEPIRAVAGAEMSIVDSATTTAQTVRAHLTNHRMANPSATGGMRLLATDSRERFARVGSQFLSRAIAPQEIELIEL